MSLLVDPRSDPLCAENPYKALNRINLYSLLKKPNKSLTCTTHLFLYHIVRILLPFVLWDLIRECPDSMMRRGEREVEGKQVIIFVNMISVCKGDRGLRLMLIGCADVVPTQSRGEIL